MTRTELEPTPFMDFWRGLNRRRKTTYGEARRLWDMLGGWNEQS